MARLPVEHGDETTWGAVLNAYLLVSHTATGALKAPDIPFGLAGVLVESTSPPIPVWRPFAVVSLTAALGTAGSAETTVRLSRGILTVAELVIPAESNVASMTLDEPALFVEGDAYLLSVAPGADAANLGGAIGCEGAG
jgi:hypothetical protein